MESGPNSVIGALVRRGKFRHTDTEAAPCEGGGRNWSDASSRCRMPRVAGSKQQLGEGPGTNSPSEPPKRNRAADILILYL